MSLGTRIFTAVSCVAIIVAVVVALFPSVIQPRLVRVHQKSVTKSIAVWGEQHSRIKNESDAQTAAAMLDYIEHYYKPGPGYRGTPDVEAQLEQTRADALRKISDALKEYRATNLNARTSVINMVCERTMTSRRFLHRPDFYATP